MKNFFKNINKKICGNVGLFFVVGIICVFGIMTFTLSRVNKQVGDVRGDSTYLTPTGSCAACDCSCICAGNSSCQTSCNSTCVTPTAVPTLTCSQQCTGITDPNAYNSCMAACSGYVNLSPTSVIPTPVCGSACDYNTQTCSYGQCINKADRCSANSMSCDSGCTSASYYCNGTPYPGAACIPPSCPVSTCPAGKTCHGESYTNCCSACSNCIACVKLVVDVAVPTTASTCVAGSCPTTCHTNTVTITNADCSISTCSPNCSTACSGDTCCPAAGFCGSGCGNHGTVPNGSCGTINCGCTECGPHRSNSGCGSWTETYDCSSSTSSGCNECVTCSPQCGQSKNCGGVCGSADTGAPAQTVINSPNGTVSSPTPIIVSTGIVPLTWLQNTSSLTDYYEVQLYDSSNALVWTTNVVGISNVSVNTLALTQGATYHWRVRATNNTCASVGVSASYSGAWSDYGYFILNQSPVFGGFNIYSSDGATEVPSQTGNRNHICQSSVFQLNGVFTRNATFRVSISDPDGYADIKKISLKMRSGTTDYVVANFDSVSGSNITGNGASFYSPVTTSVSGNSRTVNFPIHFTENFNTAIYNIEVYAQDTNGGELPVVWTDTNRDFKVWDCKIKVKGALYDGSDEPFGPVCPDHGFTNLAGSGSNFTSLVFEGVSPATSQTMSVNSPFYLSNGNDLFFSMKYNPILPNLAGTNPIFRIIDVGSGATTPTCSGSPIFPQITMLDPYVDNPELQIDFSSVLDQESWFQTVGGGINSKSVITDNVPVTCSLDSTGECKPVISRETSLSSLDSGLIAGMDIKNDSGCGSSCSFGESNNWSVKKDVIGENYSYKYFYDRYYTALGQGTVLNGDINLSSITQTGVVFVNGNLNVDTNKVVNTGTFLMLIVKGNISIANTVTNIDGIFVADGQITAGQKSDSQLIINGMIYSSGSNVSLTRGYITKEFNNTSPAVVVKYRPDFVFSMPGELVKVLSGWKEGI